MIAEPPVLPKTRDNHFCKTEVIGYVILSDFLSKKSFSISYSEFIEILEHICSGINHEEIAFKLVTDDKGYIEFQAVPANPRDVFIKDKSNPFPQLKEFYRFSRLKTMVNTHSPDIPEDKLFIHWNHCVFWVGPQ